MFLSRNDIKDARDYDLTQVQVQEWAPADASEDVYVYVRPFTAHQRSQFEALGARVNSSNKGWDELGSFAIQAVIWCVVDEDGKRVFNDGDRTWLREKSSAPINRIWQKILLVSGLTDEAQEAAVEDFSETQG